MRNSARRGPEVLERPDLERRLDGVLTRRLCTVVGGAGYGKTTLLQTWAGRHRVAWHSLAEDDRGAGALAASVATELRALAPGLELAEVLGAAIAGDVQDPDHGSRLAAFLCGALAGGLSDDVVLVLDDVHEIEPGSSAAHFLLDLCRQAPDRLHLVVASRADPPFPIARLRAQGQLAEIAGLDLAFTEEEVSALVEEVLGQESPRATATIHSATAGWPAAVRLAVEALRGTPEAGRARVLAGLSGSEGPMFTWLAEEVIAKEPPEVSELLGAVAPLEHFNGELAQALGVPDAIRLVASLERRGLLVVPQASAPWWCTLHPLVRAFAADWVRATDHSETLRRAAEWHETRGETRDALSCHRRAGDWSAVACLLLEHGGELMLAGASSEVVAAAADLPENLRSDDIVLLEADVHLARGDWPQALSCLERVVPPERPIPARCAWRMGQVHQHRGDITSAIAAFERADRDDGPLADRALLVAWESTARRQRGESKRALELAKRAVTEAELTGDDRALAAAHGAEAECDVFQVDSRAGSSSLALAEEHAKRARDVVQLTRIAVYRGAGHHLRGEYHEALQALDAAYRLTDVAGLAPFRSLVVALRGHNLLRLGRLEEARRDAQAARRYAWERGSTSVGYPALLFGELHRECGERALAQAAFEEAAEIAESSGDTEVLVAALAGLAGAHIANDPGRAEALVERALSYGPLSAQPHALLVGGWLALRTGNRQLALGRAEAVADVARHRHDRASLAATLELRAAAAEDRARRRDLLEEARNAWAEIGDPLSTARSELALARIRRDDGDAAGALELATRAADLLSRVGARLQASHAIALARALDRQQRPSVEVTTLGQFAVAVDGQPVDPRAWQSRKARDLLKILIARRGRPVHRETLIELLWPGEDPAQGSSRLSVALSTMRAVLDPSKRHEPDDFVMSDRNALRLCLERVHVDVESFLADAETGLSLRAAERAADAHQHLAAAESSYAGDFLEEDAFTEWAAPLREEVRLAYMSVARALAEYATVAGDLDAAVRYVLRILERDPYDEPAHLALVEAFASAGRHGEARRAYRGYCARMDELGVEPTLFPATGAA